MRSVFTAIFLLVAGFMLSTGGWLVFKPLERCEIAVQIRDQEIFALKTELEAWKEVK